MPSTPTTRVPGTQQPVGLGRRRIARVVSARRRLVLSTMSVCLTALFVRLGIWQLNRHGERSAGVRARAERAVAPSLEWTRPGDVPADTTGLLGRRARLAGRWDRAGEVVLRSRTLDGRAGAEVLTPLLVGGEPGQVVMVLRGWLPAPDGLHPDLAAAWPAPHTSSAADGSPTPASHAAPDGQTAPDGTAPALAQVEGVLISSRDGRGGQPLRVEIAGRSHLAIAGLDLALIRAEASLDPTPHVLRADDPPANAALRPARAVETDAGPHLSYAIQWFSFAAIALGGTAILLRSSTTRATARRGGGGRVE